MAIRFKCSCGKKLKAEDQNIGKKILCTGCGNPVIVPASSAAESMNVIASAETDDKKKKKKIQQWEDEERRKKPKFDLFGASKELGRLLIPAVVGIVVGFYALYWLVARVTTTEMKHPPLGRVTGVVTLDGKPLPFASITFVPLQKFYKEKSSSGKEKEFSVASATATSDAQGRYTAYYAPDIPGVAVGDHLIEVNLQDANGVEMIPYRFNSRTILKCTVQKGSNPCDIPVESTR